MEGTYLADFSPTDSQNHGSLSRSFIVPFQWFIVCLTYACVPRPLRSPEKHEKKYVHLFFRLTADWLFVGKGRIIERFHGVCTYLRKTRGENSLQLMTEK